LKSIQVVLFVPTCIARRKAKFFGIRHWKQKFTYKFRVRVAISKHLIASSQILTSSFFKATQGKWLCRRKTAQEHASFLVDIA